MNDKKTILIHTIGNRDLQFKPDVGSTISGDYLIKNTEKGVENYWVIKKGAKDRKETFNSYSRKILADIGKGRSGMLDNLCFPMLDHVLEYLHKKLGKPVDKVLILATQQPEAHPFDTKYVGEIIEKYYEKTSIRHSYKKLETYYLTINFKAGQPALLKDCHDMMGKIKKQGFGQIYLSNRAGLPAVTEALNFVGYFQDYQYLTIHSKEGVQEINHNIQERILGELFKKKVVDLIQNTDFSHKKSFIHEKNS